MRFGVPYKGSKNAIALWLLEHLPQAHTLVDAFAGGCAVTHAALLSGRYQRIIANDIGLAPQLFRDAIHGKYTQAQARWISREEFDVRKGSDPYIACVWSFSSNCRQYLYGRKIEAYKKACFDTLTANTVHDRRMAFLRAMRELARLDKPPAHVGEIESLWRLQSLADMDLTQDNALISTALDICCGDYRALDIPADAIIYCDIPYSGTSGYGDKFDFNSFYDWACTRPQPVYISEYNMPADRFECIAECARHEHWCDAGNNQTKIERLFIPRK